MIRVRDLVVHFAIERRDELLRLLRRERQALLLDLTALRVLEEVEDGRLADHDRTEARHAAHRGLQQGEDAAGRRAEHRERERGLARRRDAILIGHGFHGEHARVVRQAFSRPLQKTDAGVPVEMMQEIGQQHEVVGAAPVHLESAAGDRSIPIGHAGRVGIRLGDLKDGVPVDGCDGRLRADPGDGDPCSGAGATWGTWGGYLDWDDASIIDTRLRQLEAQVKEALREQALQR